MRRPSTVQGAGRPLLRRSGLPPGDQHHRARAGTMKPAHSPPPGGRRHGGPDHPMLSVPLTGPPDGRRSPPGRAAHASGRRCEHRGPQAVADLGEDLWLRPLAFLCHDDANVADPTHARRRTTSRSPAPELPVRLARDIVHARHEPAPHRTARGARRTPDDADAAARPIRRPDATIRAVVLPSLDDLPGWECAARYGHRAAPAVDSTARMHAAASAVTRRVFSSPQHPPPVAPPDAKWSRRTRWTATCRLQGGCSTI